MFDSNRLGISCHKKIFKTIERLLDEKSVKCHGYEVEINIKPMYTSLLCQYRALSSILIMLLLRYKNTGDKAMYAFYLQGHSSATDFSQIQ